MWRTPVPTQGAPRNTHGAPRNCSEQPELTVLGPQLAVLPALHVQLAGVGQAKLAAVLGQLRHGLGAGAVAIGEGEWGVAGVLDPPDTHHAAALAAVEPVVVVVAV